jgi:hypothetical protein
MDNITLVESKIICKKYQEKKEQGIKNNQFTKEK